jgi:hypothetical protein
MNRYGIIVSAAVAVLSASGALAQGPATQVPDESHNTPAHPSSAAPQGDLTAQEVQKCIDARKAKNPNLSDDQLRQRCKNQVSSNQSHTDPQHAPQ